MCVWRRAFSLLQFAPCVLVLMFFVSTGFSQITWQRTYGGPAGEKGLCVDKTSDGGYIVIGSTTSFGDSCQGYLIKVDSLGDTLWTKIYGGTVNDWGYSIQQTNDAGYIIIGSTNSFGNGYQIYLIKTDSLGETLWTKAYGDTTDEYGRSIRQTVDGGYIIAGSGYGMEVYDPVYLIKTDSMGEVLWSKIYASGEGFCIEQTIDGGYIIAAYGVDGQSCLIKTDSLGDTLWTKMYGKPGIAEYAYSVQQTTDNGFIIAGYAHNLYPPEYTQIYLIKTDSLGDTLWTKLYGEVGNSTIKGFSVQQTYDGGYIVAGITSAVGLLDVYLVKTDSAGDLLWSKTYGGTDIDWGLYVQQTEDSGYIAVGHTLSFGNDCQVYLIKTDQYGNVAGLEENNRIHRLSHRLHPIVLPNPFVSFTTVVGYEKERFILYDVSGKRVGSYPGNSIGFGLPAGVYFLISENKDFKPVRVVKVK